MRKDYLTLAKALYKPSPKVEGLVLKLCDLFNTPLPNGVTVDSISFKKGYLKLCGELEVKQVKKNDGHCGVEVHWFPNYKISTTFDPHCSAFMLRYNSLQKLYREVEKVISQMRDNNNI